MEELGATLESERVNEQGKKYRLNATIYIDAKLSNDNADQQGPGNTTQDEAADFDLSNQIPERDGCEKREQRLESEQVT
jgi:hypothetical protein